jgi:hypothetical protein
MIEADPRDAEPRCDAVAPWFRIADREIGRTRPWSRSATRASPPAQIITS